MAVPEVVKRRLTFSRHSRGIGRSVSLTRFVIGLMSVIVGISAVTGIVYFATRNYEWINVHLIPHTHDDVGWLRTPEDYYDFSVRWILTHVVEELQKNSERKFVYVETYFFWKWWNQQSEETKQVVKRLVKNGQLEMIGGGFSMSDEAVVHYQSFIDQSTWGFRLINDTFGRDVDLHIAWQIDTFGHSKELASLLALMGFDTLFFARIDCDDRKHRKAKKLMEFVWNANRNLGSAGEIFTSIFYDHYSAPKGFDFETEPVEYPIDLKEFAVYAREHAETLRTNNILVPMGDDFRFFYADNYFQKIDELIRGFSVNQQFKLNVFYSTPSRYVQAVRESESVWPIFSGDFFPYGSEEHTYWTGYYTSRPSLKYFERITNNFLQITKQLLVFSSLGYEFFSELNILREAMGVLQHHDAVSGTSRQSVTDHYVELLSDGIRSCTEPVNRALKRLMGATEDDERLMYESCLLLNISECTVSTESSRFVVTVYNPLNRPVHHYVRFPIGETEYTVQDPSGNYLKTQTLVVPQTVYDMPGRNPTAKLELMFKAEDLPPMGFKSYFVSVAPHKRINKGRRKERTTPKMAVGKILTTSALFFLARFGE
ncbi:UNVERIFIED_CONTAM: hypothetical protein PYX00_002621 [Menopon gallinae]|uniref:Glycoside hydrolase family 38 central domain-containing protein n=1 Tax=Menopon gallinae TaxID=328185 RepID=A0AAW2HY93_9NEOP